MAGTVYWITGLSGAGKTTVGKVLFERIKEKNPAVAFLDGDALRSAIGADLGYSQEARHESARRNVGICKLLADQGLDVICCTICMFEDIRRWSREHNEKYIEVYLKVPMEILRSRNQKGLYTEAVGDVVGLGVGMEEPQNPDLVVINDGNTSPWEITEQILSIGDKLK